MNLIQPARAVRVAIATLLFGTAAALAQTPPASPASAASAPITCPPPAAIPTPEQVQAGMRDAIDHGFLWRIQKDGHTSYLYGTVHVAQAAWMYPGPNVVRALRASDTLALELDPLNPDIQRRMAKGMAASSGMVLPEPLARRLRAQMQALCVPPEALASMGPEMQVATLSILAARADGLDPSYGIDIFLAGMGHGAKKSVLSLETPELQLQALQMPDQAGAIAFVENGLAELESGQARPMLLRLAKAWADADHAQLASYEEWCDCLKTEFDRDAMRRLLDDRNPGLAASIDALHASGKSVFAAVGSLHMFGTTGLPTLMAQRGYQVERVAYRNPQP
ncbi:hypothetical protein BH11PSE8_BH11PSE8_13150 [soil metagenome]